MSANLTLAETAARADAVDLRTQEVTVDLSNCRDLEQPTYPVRSTLTLETAEAETWVDYLGESVTAVLVDGAPRPVEFDGARVWLRDLPVGSECTVVIEGASRYSRSGEGLHRFQDPADGEVYLYTQYEPADARRVMPCFEQPDMKARWSFTVIGPDGWQLLTNQPEVRRSRAEEGIVVVEYAPTPQLSSYLTCIVAGPYARVEDHWTSDDGEVEVPLALLCRASLAEHLDGDELFRITKAGLGMLHDVFGPYTWGKYDQVFVPEYNLGAMENPGLVTFTEQYLFRSRATAAQYQGRSNTILHEMSHMWFGDLVTPRWWSDLWLKESFAEFMGAFLSQRAAGFDDAWLNFAIGRKAGAYAADSLPTTHPIVADIPDLEAAKNNFDRITYSKGASALTQLVHYVGEDDFFAGCRLYFARHAHDTATLADFLAALADVSGKDLAAWSDAWLTTSGHDTLVVDGDTLLRDGFRPHATTVGHYRIDGGRLVLDRREGVRVEGERTALAGGGDVVIPNDTDQTFARLQLDPASRTTVMQHLSGLEPLTRAVVWGALWTDVRAARLPMRDYVAATSRHAPVEDRPGILATLLANTLHGLDHYVAPGERAGLLADWCTTTRRAAADAEPGSDQQLQWTKAHLAAAARSDVDVAWVLYEPLPGLEISDDLTWLVWQTRAAQGRATDADLDAVLAADRTASGSIAHLRAWHSRPAAALRAAAWERAHTVDGPSNDEVDALMAGAFAPGDPALTEPFAEPYFDTLLQVWREQPIEIARRLVVQGFPRDVAHLERSGEWLREHADAPGALRRLVIERDAELRIAAAAQEL